MHADTFSSPKAQNLPLDETRRGEVLALIKLGASRRMAAEMVGCCHTTIGRLAQRDPRFARQLADAENHVDVAALTRIQEAASENKNWRAAAWVLERRHPDEFGRRTPNALTGERVMALLAQVFDMTVKRVPDEQRSDFLEEFNGVLQEVEGELARGDRWRRAAEERRDYVRGKETYRSPYEHPYWKEVRSIDELIAEMPDAPGPEFEAWIVKVGHDDVVRLRREIKHRIAQEIEDRREAFEGIREIRRQQREETEAAETAEEHSALDEDPEAAVAAPIPAEAGTTSAELPAEAGTPAPAPVAAAEPVDPQAVVEKRQQAAALQSAEPAEAGTPAQAPAEAGTTNVEQPAEAGTPAQPRARIKLPTEEEHQAYQQWVDERLPALRRNLLAGLYLQQQGSAAPGSADPQGGAQTERLVEWAETMRQ